MGPAGGLGEISRRAKSTIREVKKTTKVFRTTGCLACRSVWDQYLKQR